MFNTLLVAMVTVTVPLFQESSARQASGRDSLLVIDAIEVDPPQPGPDALCKLKVRLRNKGSQAVSDLMFDVTLNGQPLSVYSNHSWALNLGPGKDAEVKLYNFWTSESGRPVPKDGRLVVEVRVKAARWYDMDDQGSAAKPGKEVEPLPPARSVTLTISPKSGS